MTFEKSSHAVGPGAVITDLVGSGESLGSSASKVSVSSNQSWCIPRTNINGSKFSLYVECEANPNTTGRSATVTITNGCDSETVSITQGGKTDLYEFSANNTSFSFTSIGSCVGSAICAIALTCKKNGEKTGYSVTSVPSWIISQNLPSSSEYDYGVAIGANKNTSISPRSGTIILTQDESGKTIEINVTQAGKVDQTGTLRFYYDGGSGEPTSAKFSVTFRHQQSGYTESMANNTIQSGSFYSIGMKTGTWSLEIGDITEASYPNRKGLCYNCVNEGTPGNLIGGSTTTFNINADQITNLSCSPQWQS